MKTNLDPILLDDILIAINLELRTACSKFHAYNSAHEGYAVILEELDELFDEIKGQHRTKEMESEAIQVASTAIRFIIDVVYGNNPKGLISEE